MKSTTIGGAVAAICWAILLGCGSPSGTGKPPELPPVSVNGYVVQEGSAVYSESLPATVTAVNQVDVRPQVAGYITGIFFMEGQLVHRGDKLYSIDQQQYRGNYEQSKANLSVAVANLAKAQQDADRYEEMAKQDAIAKQVLDHARADLEASHKQVEAAEANVSAVETNLRYTTIYAPFSGRIGISQVKLGASVSPGQTVLNTISSDDPMGVDIALDEKQLPRFLGLQQQSARIELDSIFMLVLADQSVYPSPGRIFLIDRAVDPQTGTIKMRLVFPNARYSLRSGMTCNIRIKNNAAGKALLIPFKAVMEQMGEYFVFVVKDNKATQRKIQIGAKIKEKVIVREGLALNEQIVTDGVQKLRDGAAVQLAPQQPSPGLDSARVK